MFSQFFGTYLISKNIISKEQLDIIVLSQKSTRVKLGLIAVADNLLTRKQTEEINHIQAAQDKRFGDIAVEKGYLTNQQIEYLLARQGNPYMTFLQTAVENNILTAEDINTYLSNYQNDLNISDQEMNSLKNNDIDNIAKIFIKTEEPLIFDHFSLLLRNIIRFISTNIRIEKSYNINHYSFDTLASQNLTGKHEIFLGIAGKNDALLKIANPFAKEEFKLVDEDAFDSVCEFINCVNGLFATSLCEKSIEEDMRVPQFYQKQTFESDGLVYVVPVFIDNVQLDLIISADHTLKFSSQN